MIVQDVVFEIILFGMQMENLVPVTLVVKAANQKIADQTVECALNWTVKKLKEHLASVYPSKPVRCFIIFKSR